MFMQMPIFVELIKKMKIKQKFVSPTAYRDVRSNIVSIIGKFVRLCISGKFIKIRSLVIVNKIVTISDDDKKILVSSKCDWCGVRAAYIKGRLARQRRAKKNEEKFETGRQASNVITEHGKTLVNGRRFTTMDLMALDKNYFP